jgi:hypothetical protein
MIVVIISIVFVIYESNINKCDQACIEYGYEPYGIDSRCMCIAEGHKIIEVKYRDRE